MSFLLLHAAHRRNSASSPRRAAFASDEVPLATKFRLVRPQSKCRKHVISGQGVEPKWAHPDRTAAEQAMTKRSLEEALSDLPPFRQAGGPGAPSGRRRSARFCSSMPPPTVPMRCETPPIVRASRRLATCVWRDDPNVARAGPHRGSDMGE
jgi:hypothetical protein